MRRETARGSAHPGTRTLRRAACRVARGVPVLACVVGLLLGQARGAERPAWQRARVALDRTHVEGEFRIHYTLDGPDALPDPAGAEAAAGIVPVRIRALALQLVVARRLYVEVLGLRHPFEGTRYGGRVRHFDVHVMDVPQNGIAGDGVVNYRRPTDPPGGIEVLTIDIDRNLDARNLTPAHELFHQFQNGYTLFKNAWYTEGTARWAESALRGGAGAPGALPLTAEERAALFGRRYDAAGFWNALAQAADPAGRIELPSDIRSTHYPGGNEPVIGDDRLHGIVFIRALLEELDRADDVVSRRDNLDPRDWPEARQRSPENNEPIWDATVAACARLAHHAPGLRTFLRTWQPPRR